MACSSFTLLRPWKRFSSSSSDRRRASSSTDRSPSSFKSNSKLPPNLSHSSSSPVGSHSLMSNQDDQHYASTSSSSSSSSSSSFLTRAISPPLAQSQAPLPTAPPPCTLDANHAQPEVDTDVIIVGAGLSGLTCAKELLSSPRSHRSHLSSSTPPAPPKVLLFEASDRVGGRTLDRQTRQGGDTLEMGGQWIGPGQEEVLKLSLELGLTTFDTYNKGSSLYRFKGVNKRYTGEVPCGIIAKVDLYLAIRKLNRLSRKVPSDRPWLSPMAKSLDQVSVGAWIDDNLRTSEGRRLFKVAVLGVYAEDAEMISLLDLLASISGVGGDVDQILGDAQTTRFVEGPQSMSEKLAERLPPGVLHLGESILRIEEQILSQRSETKPEPSMDGCQDKESGQGGGEEGRRRRRNSSNLKTFRIYKVTTSKGNSFTARHVVLTMPRPSLSKLTFQPPLPALTSQLLQHQPMASVIKYNIVYSRPFWRENGLNGSSVVVPQEVGEGRGEDGKEGSPISNSNMIQLTSDNSPPDGRSTNGVLVAFTLGSNSRRYSSISPDQRKRSVLSTLSEIFGEESMEPIQFEEKVWSQDPFSMGGYGTYYPPGVLTGFADACRVDRVRGIHFAGDATSHVWTGYMEGAILSAKRASAQVIQALPTQD
ncbi:hypothetical protein IE53DRAFT_385308 [Violaceomyces palustris]|uniref:Uncharacterized protein n=1 Tax=Violaceomyces palustris TaxID=1673888 RepID=A0ACD0P2J5_9BASI|nr:hypothetical protein IE53DRAFT_385308 [Violaceomyces palustris]